MDCVGCDKCRLWGKVQVGYPSYVIYYSIANLFSYNEKLLDNFLFSICENSHYILFRLNAFGNIFHLILPFIIYKLDKFMFKVLNYYASVLTISCYVIHLNSSIV